MAAVRFCFGASAVILALCLSACANGAATDDGSSGDVDASDEGANRGNPPSGAIDAGGARDTGGGTSNGNDSAPPADANPPPSDGATAGDAHGAIAAGLPCQTDGDCLSGLCKPVLLGQSVCVTPCTRQSDCANISLSFCDPLSVGAPSGYCVPRSPSHCLSCNSDSDCGSLSESCFQAPGDNAKACHVDCDLAGDAACPADYSCEAETVNGGLHKMCVPKVGTCLDSVGGFCDRIGTPQACTRANTAGTCIGQRPCLSLSNRFDKCDAQAPQCKVSCAAQDPAGCTTSYCAGAVSTPDNCGTCGNVCPGFGKTADNVSCNGGCKFSCIGESYDVNGNPSDGCELADAPVGNHTQGVAVFVGSFPCDDGSSSQNITGQMPSDTRVHENPPVTGFDVASGSAPDYFHIYASGGSFCQNDANLSLQVFNSVHASCYALTLTNVHPNDYCATDSGGHCSISNSSGSYGDGTDIYVTVSKTCSTAATENVTYAVTGHL